ncbi:MAG: C4-dicarboxylate TRAP transporter substrate-binding protein [Methyloligellaceae bacterium]
MIKRTLLLSAALAITATGSSTVGAAEYIYGSWNGPKNAVIKDGVVPYLQAVEKETGGSLKWKVIAGGQLFGGRAALAGIRDKVADAGGPIIPAFNRKELRAVNVVYDLVNASTSPVVMAGATAETLLLDCPQCTADFAKNNTHFLANYSTTRFNVMCREPVKTVADLKGRKMRVVGALSRLIKSVGGVPIGGPPTKAVQALQKGSMDCIVGPISWLQSFGLWDITKHVLDAELALQPTPSSFVVNRNSWKAMSAAERKAHVTHAPMLVANTVIKGYMTEDSDVRAAAKKRGIVITRAGAGMEKALSAHKEKELTVVPTSAKDQGVKDPNAIVKAHLENVAKWEKIYAKTGDDPAKFAQALWDEVYSKINPDKL